MSTPPTVSVAFTAEDRGISAAVNALSTQLKSLAVQQQEVAATSKEAAAGEEEFSASMHEAKGAAALLGEEVGVKLNRHLRGVLASSETLGPILAAAFPVAAALGFAEVIVQAAEKLSTFIGEQFIYTEEQKKSYDLDVEYNKERVKQIDIMKQLTAEYDRLGKSAAQVAALNLQDATKTLKQAEDALAAVKKKADEPLSDASFLAQLTGQLGAAVSGKGGLFGIGGREDANAEAQANQKKAREDEQFAAQGAVDQAAEREKIASEKSKEAHQKDIDDRQKAEEEAHAKLVEEGVRYLNELKQGDDAERKLKQDQADFGKEIADKELIESSKALDIRIEAENKANELAKENNEKAAVDAITLQQKEVEARASRGDITGKQETDQLQALATQKLAIENEYLDARESEIFTRMETETGEAYAQDLAAFTALQEQKRTAQDRYYTETQAAQDAGQKHLLGFAAAQKSITGDLTNFFETGITQAKSFGDAMANLAKSIISDLQKMAAEYVITAIKQKLLGTGGSGGGGGGGVLAEGGSALSGALGLAFAGGGPVTGPGGPKSDQVPAMLSSGEFVMNAEAVKALGSANLQALNMASDMPHLAAGGFVGGGGQATASEISMGIGLDEGLILRHLSSKAAGKVILQQLTNNSKGAQRALGRTD